MTSESTSQRGNAQHGESAASKGKDAAPNPFTKLEPAKGVKIRRVVAVMSGKGGVGKSSVAALLAVALRRDGHSVGVLDADITGPSIPRIFGVRGRPGASPAGAIMPVRSKSNIPVMSINLLLNNEDEPVIWRGPLISGVVKQFFSEVDWGELDYLILDLPPGTGDAPLTVMQSVPLDGIILVASPQGLAHMIVRKAQHMAESLGVPILGLVENFSVMRCPHCGAETYPFGKSKADELARHAGLPLLGRLPIDPALAEAADAGEIEDYQGDWVSSMASWVDALEYKDIRPE